MTVDYCTGQDCWVCRVLRHETRHEETSPAETAQVSRPRRPGG